MAPTKRGRPSFWDKAPPWSKLRSMSRNKSFMAGITDEWLREFRAGQRRDNLTGTNRLKREDTERTKRWINVFCLDLLRKSPRIAVPQIQARQYKLGVRITGESTLYRYVATMKRQ